MKELFSERVSGTESQMKTPWIGLCQGLISDGLSNGTLNVTDPPPPP